MTLVREWTGREARALRHALRMPMRAFADYLGVSPRTVAKWESLAQQTSPRPDTQAILDTALSRADAEAAARFRAFVNHCPIDRKQPQSITSRTPSLVVDGDPGLVRARELYMRGHSLLTTNEKPSVQMATVLLESAIQVDPDLASAMADRGYGQWRQYFAGWESDTAMLSRALADVDDALRADPSSIRAHAAFVRICWDLGWHETAVEYGGYIHREFPESLDASLTFARALHNAGLAQYALPMTRSVLRADPTNPTALKLAIWNHLMIGQYRDALEIAHRYLPTHPGDANTRWAVALCQHRMGLSQAAIDTASAALRADPDDVTIWTLLGYLHRQAGDEAAAQDAWQDGVDRITSSNVAEANLRIQAWLANLLAASGQRERALDYVDQLERSGQSNGYIEYRLAHALAEIGDTGKAIRLLRQSIQHGFLSIQLLEHEQLMGLAHLSASQEYQGLVRTLHENVTQLRRRYLSPENAERRSRAPGYHR